MRELTFVVEPPVGPGERPVRGSLADLVLKLPGVVGDAIPPRRVLNDVLRQGICDAGMSGGCIWEPFEIDPGEYEELVHELQRRGTRPAMGGDPGGKRFELPDPPDSVRTYLDWVDYRYEQRLGSTPRRSQEAEGEDASSNNARWLELLPVADLYLGYLQALDRDWRARGDDAFDLPAELVAKLRELAGLVDEWLYEGGRLGAAEYQQWVLDWAKQAEQVRREARACVDHIGLPRWPYSRLAAGAP